MLLVLVFELVSFLHILVVFVVCQKIKSKQNRILYLLAYGEFSLLQKGNSIEESSLTDNENFVCETAFGEKICLKQLVAEA